MEALLRFIGVKPGYEVVNEYVCTKLLVFAVFIFIKPDDKKLPKMIKLRAQMPLKEQDAEGAGHFCASACL